MSITELICEIKKDKEKTKTFFGFLVTIWLTLNELLSILENVGRLGVALPQFLIDILVEMKKDVDERGTK